MIGRIVTGYCAQPLVLRGQSPNDAATTARSFGSDMEKSKDQVIVLGQARWSWVGNPPVLITGLRDLPAAVKANNPAIIVKIPDWLPRVCKNIFVLVVLAILVLYSQERTASNGMKYGYNVERCQKLKLNGIEFSDCVKLTKPQLPPTPPATEH